MLLELASHPLSFVTHLLGAPDPRSARGEDRGEEAALSLTVVGVPTRVDCRRVAGTGGIVHRLQVTGTAGRLELQGHWRVGESWTYGPTRLDGLALAEVESPAEDCWHRATVRSIGTALAVLRGELAPATGVAAGLGRRGSGSGRRGGGTPAT